jgi:hypothetical protein
VLLSLDDAAADLPTDALGARGQLAAPVLELLP